MPHPEHDTGAAAASHVDEGTIHAWLDDALPADERRAVEVHVAACAQCAAAVAEARGLVAGASRILSALDGGLGAVSAAPPIAAATPIAAARAGRAPGRRWWTGANARAAAALLIVAGGSGILLTRAGPSGAGFQLADSTATAESVADLRVDSQVSMPPSDVAPRAAERTAVAFDASPDSVAGPEERRGRVAARAESRADVAARPPMPSIPMPAPPLESSSAVAMAAPPVAAPTAPVAAAPAAMSRGVAGGVARSTVGAARMEAQVLRGVVREAGTQQPVAGATVTIAGAGAAAVTDSTGRFTLRDVPPGRHLAQAQRVGYSADTLSVAVVPGRPTDVRVELQKSANAMGAAVVTSERAAAGSARGFAASVAAPAPRELAGCYWMAAPAVPAGALPGLVRLDTTLAADGDFTARLADSAGGQWPPARWTVSGARATVAVSWRTTLGRTQLDLTRVGRDLAGTARLPGDAERATPRGVRLVRTACASATPRP